MDIFVAILTAIIIIIGIPFHLISVWKEMNNDWPISPPNGEATDKTDGVSPDSPPTGSASPPADDNSDDKGSRYDVFLKEINNDWAISPPNGEATDKTDGVSPDSPPTGSASPPADDNSDVKGSRYDVFLSFRGPDTRKGFAGHLHKALKDRSINAFMDMDDLPKGEDIRTLLKIIEESRILVPIFSKGYAKSDWCMKEITKMVQMRAMGKVQIIPVFFDVEPLEVRNWSALNWDKSDASVAEKEKWKKALQTAARIHGFNLTNHANGFEPKLLELIVKDVVAKLEKTPLHIANYPIGLDCRVQGVMEVLKNEGRDVKMIGLQGMPGIGKTTIAKAVYNELCDEFDGASAFISDVGEKFRGKAGVKCQEQLIHDTMPSEERSRCYIGGVADGKIKFKGKLKCRKVLIVLDDIDDIEQLQALAGGRDWFGPGSVIIITSKHEEVLLQHNMEDCQIYKPELLDDEESFQLFVSHVFEGGQPTTIEERDLSEETAKTAGGLPIALAVLGPHFSACRRDMADWREDLTKLKDIPHEGIQKKLRISYDRLEDIGKAIFLDISCFFIGADCGGAPHYYWEACGFYPKYTIRLLQRRSLISLDKENRFHMHDLLRNMGMEIVLERGKELPSSPRTRLWSSDDIFTLLQKNDVPSHEVPKAIMLNQGGEAQRELCNSVECFRNMHHLKLLHMEGVNFKNNFHHFPSELMWLGLPRCFLQSLPTSGLNLQKLVILNLSNCNLARLFFSVDLVFKDLKVLDLSATDLTTTPDFCNFPCLKELTLQRCEKLTEVHRSIGKLKKSLVILDMRTCTQLEKLPDTICNLESIEVLHLGWCEKLSSLPEQIGYLTSLKELSLNDTGIGRIPDSVGKLTSLHELLLQRCKWLGPLPDSVSGWFSSGKLKLFEAPLKMIDGIDLSDIQDVLRAPSCKLLDFLPKESCKGVEKFYLSDPTIQELSHIITRLQNLVVLSLKCEQLRELPAWISGQQLKELRDLEIESKSLKTLPESIESLKGLTTLKLVCENLESLPDFENLESLEMFEVASRKLEQIPRSIGCLRSLAQLKVECPRIKPVPESIIQLQGLQIFELHVDNPEALPDSTALPKKLKKFSLSCKDLDNVPDCVWSLGELETLSLRGCGRIESLPGEKLMQLKSLIHLDLSQTGVKEIHKNICFLPKLRSLQINDVGNGTFWFELPQTSG